MDTSKILGGCELVARGVTKSNATLPESGQKDISSSGSWLESKQIQSALEARKHLLEVERIEKLGSLSIAIWRDDLRLAEVIRKAGSCWQYIGHNLGKHLYLRPEETLFLIEINCLLLKHNEVTVSLQKAYTLCLGEINLAQYKVYASLSRLGYRVFRHRNSSPAQNNQQTINNHLNNQAAINDINREEIKTSQHFVNEASSNVNPTELTAEHNGNEFKETLLKVCLERINGNVTVNSNNIESAIVEEFIDCDVKVETNITQESSIFNSVNDEIKTVISNNSLQTKCIDHKNENKNTDAQNRIIVKKMSDSMDIDSTNTVIVTSEKNITNVSSADKIPSIQSENGSIPSIANKDEISTLNENIDPGGQSVIVCANNKGNNIKATAVSNVNSDRINMDIVAFEIVAKSEQPGI